MYSLLGMDEWLEWMDPGELGRMKGVEMLRSWELVKGKCGNSTKK